MFAEEGEEMRVSLKIKSILDIKKSTCILDAEEYSEAFKSKEPLQHYRDASLFLHKDLPSNVFLNSISEGFSRLEVEDLRVVDIVMDSETFRDLKNCRNMKVKGKTIPYLWGALVWVKNLPEGKVLLYSSEETRFKKDFPEIFKKKKALGV